MYTDPHSKTVMDKDLQAAVLDNSRPVLVEFYAEWCGACHIIAPVIGRLQTKYGDRFEFLRLEAEKCQKTMAVYGIRRLPTLLIFSHGKLVEHITGAVPYRTLADKLRALLPMANP